MQPRPASPMVKLAALLVLLVITPLTVIVALNRQESSSHAASSITASSLTAYPKIVTPGREIDVLYVTESKIQDAVVRMYNATDSTLSLAEKQVGSECAVIHEEAAKHIGLCVFPASQIAGDYIFKLITTGQAETIIAVSDPITITEATTMQKRNPAQILTPGAASFSTHPSSPLPKK